MDLISNPGLGPSLLWWDKPVWKLWLVSAHALTLHGLNVNLFFWSSVFLALKRGSSLWLILKSFPVLIPLYSVVYGRKLKFLFVTKQVCLALSVSVLLIFINWPPENQDFFCLIKLEFLPTQMSVTCKCLCECDLLTVREGLLPALVSDVSLDLLQGSSVVLRSLAPLFFLHPFSR